MVAAGPPGRRPSREGRPAREDGGIEAAASRRSAELVARCGGVRSPSLGGVEEPLLSEREREVALLAAGGRSNREIAEQLVLSARTVETHLRRSYVKLGITRRDELGSVLAAVRG